MIDMHTHIGHIWHGRRWLRAGDLVRWMDRHGIDQAVVMSVENPEELHYYVPTPYVVKSCRRHAHRLIPFCNVDPRIGDSSVRTDFRSIIEEYVEQGARGFGEMLSGLAVDDPRRMAIYRVCGELRLPVTLHIDHLRGTDELGLPRLRRVLSECPDTTFLAHAMHWWAEISGDVCYEDKAGYPARPVVPGGAVEEIFEAFPNIYGDLSANSGYNALTRDAEFGRAFLERRQDRLCFATDYLMPGQKCPIIDFIREVDILTSARRKIMEGNARRILNLEAPA
jgi:hypothetical protein